MNKCKNCGCEIKEGEICSGCAVAQGLEAMLEILARNPIPGVTVRDSKNKETEKKN